MGPLVWGTVVGFALQAVALAILLGQKSQLPRPRLSFRSPQWAGFWQGFGVVLTGQALMSVTPIVDQFFAAHLGMGAIARFAYANRILILVLSLGATTVTRATLPVFSQAEARGGGHLEAVGRRWLVLLALLGALAAIVGWIGAPWAVKILFERGAFGSAETGTVTLILRYGLGQLPFYFASLVLVSLLVSQRKYGVLSVIAGVNLVTKIAGNAMLVPRFGVSGLMLATSLMLAGSCLLLMLAVFAGGRFRPAAEDAPLPYSVEN
jgi:putative peptidoglycan lipid II flippase